MKFLAAAAVLLSLFSFILPTAVYLGTYTNTDTDETDQMQIREQTDTEPIMVTLLDGNTTRTIELEEYVTGVVAGEMPAEFEMEALKAQAVASRTYTLYKMYVQPSDNHDENVCTDAKCCKAFAEEQTLMEKWGSDYQQNMDKITQAVAETAGEYMEYENEPILAVFHSSSAGQTASSAEVWQSQLPYLMSVASPESADNVTNYIANVTVSGADFAATIGDAYPQAQFDDDINSWIGDMQYTDSGRVAWVNIGGVDITGTQIRQLFQLRSAAFTISIDGENVIFETTGYGHGVGMSQYGANIMAENGSTYDEILTWYYTGADIAAM